MSNNTFKPNAPGKQRQRWRFTQFSLHTILLLTTVVAILCGIQHFRKVREIEREREIGELVQQFNDTVDKQQWDALTPIVNRAEELRLGDPLPMQMKVMQKFGRKFSSRFNTTQGANESSSPVLMAEIDE